MMGAGATIAQSCVIAPSLLIDDLEMERMEEEFPKDSDRSAADVKEAFSGQLSANQLDGLAES